jgi:hypothetical protein
MWFPTLRSLSHPGFSALESSIRTSRNRGIKFSSRLLTTKAEIFHVSFEGMSILFGWIFPILFFISLAKSQKGIPAIVDDHEVPRAIGEIIQQWNGLETGTHVVQVLNFVKKTRNYGKVRGMVGDVIAEIPKENPVVRLTENWMDVGQSKIAKIAGSLMIVIFDEIATTDVSSLFFFCSAIFYPSNAIIKIYFHRIFLKIVFINYGYRTRKFCWSPLIHISKSSLY